MKRTYRLTNPNQTHADQPRPGGTSASLRNHLTLDDVESALTVLRRRLARGNTRVALRILKMYFGTTRRLTAKPDDSHGKPRTYLNPGELDEMLDRLRRKYVAGGAESGV